MQGYSQSAPIKQEILSQNLFISPLLSLFFLLSMLWLEPEPELFSPAPAPAPAKITPAPAPAPPAPAPAPQHWLHQCLSGIPANDYKQTFRSWISRLEKCVQAAAGRWRIF